MYKVDDIRSMGVLQSANTDLVRLTPVFHGCMFPHYVHLRKEEYKKISHDDQALRERAVHELNLKKY